MIIRRILFLLILGLSNFAQAARKPENCEAELSTEQYENSPEQYFIKLVKKIKAMKAPRVEKIVKILSASSPETKNVSTKRDRYTSMIDFRNLKLASGRRLVGLNFFDLQEAQSDLFDENGEIINDDFYREALQDTKSYKVTHQESGKSYFSYSRLVVGDFSTDSWVALSLPLSAEESVYEVLSPLERTQLVYQIARLFNQAPYDRDHAKGLPGDISESDEKGIRPKLALERAARGDYIGVCRQAATSFMGMMLELGYPLKEFEFMHTKDHIYVARTNPVTNQTTFYDPTPGSSDPLVQERTTELSQFALIFFDAKSSEDIPAYLLR